MKMSLTAAALAFCVTCVTPTFAMQAGGASDGTDSNQATLIQCRHVPAPTGTRIGARNICKTAREWDEIEAAARENLDRAARTRLNCSNGGAGTQCGQ